MPILAMVLCLVLILAACGQPAGSLGAPNRRVQLADNPFDIPVAASVNPDPRVGTAPAPGSHVSVIGCGAGVGGTPIGCQNSTGMNPLRFPSFWCKGLVDGTSGSPWISVSTVTGVTGGLQRGGCTQWVSYSAPFNERTAALLARAEAGGRGEAPPLAFLGC